MVIDDEPDLCSAAAEWLGVCGFTVSTYTDPRQAIREVIAREVDCVVTDLRMPGLTGLEVLSRIQSADPDLPVILLTGHGDVQMAVGAIKSGAYDFIEKPHDPDRLVAVLDRAVERRRLSSEVGRLTLALEGKMAIEDRLVGSSAPILTLRKRIAQLADIDVDVLIQGETGTGKEVVARALHDFGKRSKGRFVAINCAAVPEAIFESEIFGHDRGAFTGADRARVGKLEHADGGTVFLDEIESMPMTLQAKVLRAIQERTVERLGSNTPRQVDVRFIAATKLDLKAESEAGRFRADLYFRLATVDLAIPALRERRDDIPLLFALFVEQAARRFGVTAPPVSEAIQDRLGLEKWPGNVRELKAAADRFALRMDDLSHHDGLGSKETGSHGTLAERVARIEASMIAESLHQADGSTALAAERLGLPRRTLNEKIARYNLRDGVSAEA